MNPSSKVVYLTFDDGPIPECTPHVLDILARYGVKASFFMVGENAERYPDLLQRVRAEGHTVGNHSVNHLHLTGLTDEEIYSEIIGCEENYYKLTGKLSYLESAYSEKSELYEFLDGNTFECIIDAGAYNGDTVRDAKKYFPNLKKAYAIEPDPKTFKKLKKYSEAETEIEVISINSALAFVEFSVISRMLSESSFIPYLLR